MFPVGPDHGFGLYVHWPYCARICPYCDFNVYAAKDRDNGPLIDAIIADIHSHRLRLPDHPMLDSVFLGGGTPSLLKGADMARILEAASNAFGLKTGAEVSLEANPNNANAHETLRDWKAAGITRLSIGVQSFDPKGLRLLGRDHGPMEAYETMSYAPQHFEHVSLDMIYAWPGQTLSGWEEELKSALDLSAGHLSLYELTIEQRTAFGKQVERGEMLPKSGDEQADFYELTQALCDDWAVPAYEVSNHASDVHEQSIHNNIYWNSGDWIGVGPGAHGRLTIDGKRIATEAALRPGAYVTADSPVQTVLSNTDTAHEFLAMGLRPTRGLDLSRYEQLFGQLPPAETLQDLAENDLALIEANRLKLTVQGRLMADHITGLLSR